MQESQVCLQHHNTSSPTEVLTDLHWKSLTTRRARIKLCTFYKIHHGLLDICSPQYIHLVAPRTRTTHDLAYFEISTRTTYYEHSFYPSTIRSAMDQSLSNSSSGANLDGIQSCLGPASSVDYYYLCFNQQLMALSHSDTLHQCMPTYVNFHQHGGVH